MNGDFSRFVAAFAVFFLLSHVVLSEDCSRTCIATNCNNFAIRYGKYCGIGYFGCPGEAPCDDLDSCCMVHDNCVTVKGMTYIACHKQFKRCVNRLSRAIKSSGNKKVGFSPACPYSVVIPTVYQGMDLGIFFSGIGNIVPKLPGTEGVAVEADLSKSGVDIRTGLGTTGSLNVSLDTHDGRPKAVASLSTNSSSSVPNVS
ncbi:PREDICTED: phospholipase A2-beta-like [Tarenaya hassleriana]|uniref:phospholipase A2-beta-like n=1 Tax=Tarenaya hassleriana TaxID=28532 RepID=UPI00053C1810|nr:PREDICTED: phospholipase A2-beta-like [Tarenaya hassleriana]